MTVDTGPGSTHIVHRVQFIDAVPRVVCMTWVVVPPAAWNESPRNRVPTCLRCVA